MEDTSHNHEENTELSPIKKDEKGLIRTLIGVFTRLLSTAFRTLIAILKFFLKLKIIEQFFLIMGIILVGIFFYVWGFNNGVGSGKIEVEEEVYKLTGYEVYELNRLVEQIKELKNSLNSFKENK